MPATPGELAKDSVVGDVPNHHPSPRGSLNLQRPFALICVVSVLSLISFVTVFRSTDDADSSPGPGLTTKEFVPDISKTEDLIGRQVLTEDLDEAESPVPAEADLDAESRYFVDLELVSISASLGRDGVLNLIGPRLDEGKLEIKLDLDSPGAISPLNRDDQDLLRADLEFLVVGSKLDAGKLFLITQETVADKHTYVVADTATIPSSSLVGGAYDAEQEKLYVLDARQKRILVGDHNPRNGMLPKSWSMLIDGVESEAFARAGKYDLWADRKDGQLDLYLNEAYWGCGRVINGPTRNYAFEPGLDSFIITVLPSGEVRTTRVPKEWRLGYIEGDLNTGMRKIEVSGPSDSIMRLMEMSDAGATEIASCVTGWDGFGTFYLSQDRKLAINRAYGVLSDSYGSMVKSHKIPVVRIGRDEPLDQGRFFATDGGGSQKWLYLHQEINFLSLSIGHESPEREVIPSKYRVLFAMGTAAELKSRAGRDYLQVDDYLEFSVDVDSRDKETLLFEEFPVIDDARLVGTVLYHQWIVLTPEPRLSAITGEMVTGGDWPGLPQDLLEETAERAESPVLDVTVKSRLGPEELEALGRWKKRAGFRPIKGIELFPK